MPRRKDPWVHWVIYKIPANLTGLPEAVPAAAQAEGPGGGVAGAKLVAQGAQPRLSWADAAARPRLHHYHFKLYALDAKLAVEPGLDKSALLRELDGHRLAEGELVGTFQSTSPNRERK